MSTALISIDTGDRGIIGIELDFAWPIIDVKITDPDGSEPLHDTLTNGDRMAVKLKSLKK